MDKNLFIKKHQDIENGFNEFLVDEAGYAKTVLSAMNYSVNVGGKRLRPMFMKEAFTLFGGEDEKIIRPFMMAMEMIHTYSLVHDDLPAMDNDELRRGKPTTHVKYGEDMAILTGDALLNRAYETAFLAFDYTNDFSKVAWSLKVLSKKAGIEGMVGGQVVDVENNGTFVDEDTLMYVYKNKTSALIEASLMIGGILAGAKKQEVDILEKIGTSIGIAFQIKDDILDELGDEEVIGKPVHSDKDNAKSTYLAIHGLEKSQKKVKELTTTGLGLLEKIQTDNPRMEEAKKYLYDLFVYLIDREN